MKNQWRIIIGFALVLLVVLFAILNNSLVKINFLIGNVSAPLILIILGSAIVGILIALLTSTSTMWNQKKKIEKLEKEIAIYRDDMDKQVDGEKEKIVRKYENQTSELRAAYESQLVDRNRQLEQLQNSKQEEHPLDKLDKMDYFD